MMDKFLTLPTFVVISVLIITINLHLVNGKVHIINGKIFGKQRNKTLTVFGTRKIPKDATQNWIKQPVDHHHENIFPQWDQRYFVNMTNYSDDGPICIFVGGEAEADPRWLAYGEMAEQSVPLKAKVMFFLEHRFYGQSWPLSDASVANLRYLTMDQALNDLAKFIVKMKDIYGLERNKVVLYGGSYPATLVAYFRQKFPKLADVGVASSAPINFHFNFKEYLEEVGIAYRVTNRKCLAVFSEGIRIMNDKIKKAGQKCQLDPQFGNPAAACPVDLKPLELCDPLDVRNTLDVMNLNGYIVSSLSYIAQYNNSINSGGLTELCNYIAHLQETNSTLSEFDIFAKSLKGLTGFLYQAPCIDYSNAKFCSYLAETSKQADSVVSGSRQWVWQLCSDFATFETTSSSHQPFGHGAPPELFVAQCECAFGERFNQPYIRHNVHMHQQVYGGYSTPRTFVIYTNGQHDPVSRLGYRNQQQLQMSPGSSEKNELIVIEGGSHCVDMEPSKSDDWPSLVEARQRTLKLIEKWINN